MKRWQEVWLLAGLGICLLTGGTALVRADDHDHDCDKRIHQAEARLQKEIDKHGEHSPQADRRRHELEETRRSCGR
jgi:hypothetical protein